MTVASVMIPGAICRIICMADSPITLAVKQRSFGFLTFTQHATTGRLIGTEIRGVESAVASNHGAMDSGEDGWAADAK